MKSAPQFTRTRKRRREQQHQARAAKKLRTEHPTLSPRIAWMHWLAIHLVNTTQELFKHLILTLKASTSRPYSCVERKSKFFSGRLY